MRLIDADALFSTLNDAKWYDNADREIALDYVEDAPTVDAVPVVRCKDCKFRFDGHYCNCGCWHTMIGTEDDDFCSMGERRD